MNLFLVSPGQFLPTSLMGVLAFVFILLALVLLHEFGHFVAAKMFGIRVLEFGVGFPPKAKGWTFGETEYSINWLPIGGFVRLLGEEDPSDPRSLAAASRPKRLAVMFAGVFMNLVVAVLLLTVSFMIPRERPLSQAQVTEIAADSPAYCADISGTMRDGSAPATGLSAEAAQAKQTTCNQLYGSKTAQGLQPGDIVQEVEGRDVQNITELIYANRLHLGELQEWKILRNGSTLTAYVYARWHPPAGQGPTGIRIGSPSTCSGVDDEGNPTGCEYLYPFTERVQYWPHQAFVKGLESLWETVILTRNEMRVRFGGGGGGASISSDQPTFTGPVGIAAQTTDIIKADGWRPLIELAALLSLNLGIFNALPIPMLDGGRMFFVFVEILRGGRRIAPEREAMVHMVGFALLMTGVIVVTYFDVARLIS